MLSSRFPRIGGSDGPGGGLVRVLACRFIGTMGEPNVGSKHARHFPKAIWIWTKLRFTKGTFVIARKSPVAVFGCGEAWFCPHTQSLRRTPIYRRSTSPAMAAGVMERCFSSVSEHDKFMKKSTDVSAGAGQPVFCYGFSAQREILLE
jgi:hypothetical protein